MQQSPATSHSWPSGGGELGELIRNHDWAATPLGPIGAWPASLRILVDLVVHSPQPMVLMWGADLIQLYNDGYAAVCGPRHPRALGQSNRDCWPEAQAFVQPVYDDVWRGRARSFGQQKIVIERHGVAEDAWFDLSYTPAYGEGAIRGIVATVIDTTEAVRTAQALMLNDERFNTFSNASVVYRMSADWREMRQLVGQGVLADTLGPTTGWLDLHIHPQDQPTVRAAIAEAIRTSGVFELEHRVRLADGSLGWTLSRAVPLLDAGGAIREWFGTATDVTDRKRAAEDLRRADERIALALDAGAVTGTWYWEVVSDRFTADRRFAGFFSLDPDAMQQGVPLARVLQAIHPDDTARVAAQIDRTLADGGRYRAEYRVDQGDGSFRWVEATGRVTRDDAGRALTFPGVIVDIEERKRRDAYQGALLRLGDRLRQLDNADEAAAVAAEIVGTTLGVARVALGRVGPGGKTVEVRDCWRAHPGVVPTVGVHSFSDYGSYVEDLRRGDVVVVADVGADPRTAALRTAFEALGSAAFIEMPVVDKHGFAAILTAHHDRPHAWQDDEIAFIKGVTDRTWAEMARADAAQALRGLNQRLAHRAIETTQDRDRLWQLSSDIMLVARFDGRITAVNPAWHDMLGWSESELVGASLFDLLHPDDLAYTIEAAQSLDDSGKLALRFENRYRHRDGGYRWISWNANKSDTLVLAVGRDVSQERERAAMLLETEEKLRHSQKMEAVGQLTGGLAHDFNNLLAGITGSLELMQRRLKQGRHEDLERYINVGQGAARRAAALTHRLLAFSRRQTLDPKATDINRLVRGIEDLIRRTIGPENQLEVVGAVGLWITQVDPHQLENALLNLCLNARDAMPGGGRLTIETANKWMDERIAKERDLPPGQYVSLCVTDTGTGMAPDVAQRVFEPFFTTKPIGMGTGLGLSMVHGFARQSGGQVRVYSEPGLGTTMCLYLPRHYEAEAVDEPPPSAGEAPHAGAGTVLVVDDEPTVRALVSDVLVELGWRVLEAEEGATGLALLQTNVSIDLLITDVGLPGGMNGRQLADAARAGRPELKVLFITGYAENAVVGNGHLDPGMEVMTKPFTLDALAVRVQQMVDAKS